MLSPEAEGGDFFRHGSVEARIQSTTRDKPEFRNNQINNPLEHDTGSELAILGSASLFRRLDFYASPSVTRSPPTYGVKFQILGQTRQEAKEGSYSLSLAAGHGRVSQKWKDDNNFFTTSNIDTIRFRTDHGEVGLIGGYRWTNKFLHYANVFYMNTYAHGVVTSDNGTLQDTSFNYTQDALLYSTGLIYYTETHWYIKFDLSHLVSDWNHTNKVTANSYNFAYGFRW